MNHVHKKHYFVIMTARFASSYEFKQELFPCFNDEARGHFFKAEFCADIFPECNKDECGYKKRKVVRCPVIA